MSAPTRIHPADVLGFSRLAVDATSGVLGVVEAMHSTIADTILPGTPANGIVAAATAAAYTAIRAITGLVGGGIDTMLATFAPAMENIHSSVEREAMLAALNGVVGDHLASTNNPLAIPIRFRRNGRPLAVERKHLRAAIPGAGGKLLVLVHGLCMNDLQWTRHGHNHGSSLATDLGWTPVHLHFNSGLHVSTNGRAFDGLLETLVEQWPVPVRELAILGHSLGGLIARSAHYYGSAAGHRWLHSLRRLVFMGTPHHGSALERAGNWLGALPEISPYAAPIARIARIRSAGITDLRHGNLLDEDWQGVHRFRHSGDRRRFLPLPQGVKCFAIAASRATNPDALGRHLGDGLVGVDSALGRHHLPAHNLTFPKSHQWIAPNMGHWDLLSHPAVYRKLRKWLAS